MKLRKLLVVLLVLGLLAVYYILGTGYRDKRLENAALASQIAAATQQLALIPPPPADLDQRLATANSSLEKEKNSFPARMSTTRVVNDILRLAEAAGVKAVPLITQPWVTENINQANYSVFRLNLTAGGTYAQLGDFLDRLENGEPGTLVITNLKVERVNGASGDENPGGATAGVEASLDIAVYAQPPAGVPVDKVE
jgi:hypothetical protein